MENNDAQITQKNPGLLVLWSVALVLPLVLLRSDWLTGPHCGAAQRSAARRAASAMPMIFYGIYG